MTQYNFYKNPDNTYVVTENIGFEMYFQKKGQASRICKFLNDNKIWPKGDMKELNDYLTRNRYAWIPSYNVFDKMQKDKVYIRTTDGLYFMEKEA